MVKKKEEEINKKLLAFAFILVLISLYLVFTIDLEEEFDWEWVKDNCECIERNRLICGFEGYELGKRDFCWNEKKFTNPREGCSKYDCIGMIYIYEGE